jgi:hypothetical protein
MFVALTAESCLLEVLLMSIGASGRILAAWRLSEDPDPFRGFWWSLHRLLGMALPARLMGSGQRQPWLSFSVQWLGSCIG